MKYVKVTWTHDFTDEPVLYLSELGADGYETRKVQYYRNGRSEWADQSHETDTAGLAEVAFPPLNEISDQPEFNAVVITPDEFERAWNEARSDR
ncbi:hypothetical protein [Actinoplanes sp. NBRC 103695]|uniref:DUF6881 domain-containing protein n=1 Tax=Actinoplanes sp. NBRC 103695 TaxID=3032202 RepID=UPI0024A1F524|nr:hypothetical protein [Actinoplanes sp. NBRC 103695]GLY97832.1 hypothetical protein Acsp02_50860 [Actinoplanes sp. NBRC 103695]